MKNITEILILVVYSAIVFTLVRPGSQGPKVIEALGNGFSSILEAGMGSVPQSKGKK